MQITKGKVQASGELMTIINRFANILDKFFEKLGEGGDADDTIIVAVMPDNYAKEHKIEVKNGEAYAENGDKIDPDKYPYKCKIKFVEYDDNGEETDNEGDRYGIYNFYLSDTETKQVLKDLGVRLLTLKGKQNVAQQNTFEHLSEILKKATNNDTENVAVAQLVTSSQSMKVTLRKIMSATSTDIELTSISATADPNIINEALDTILDDEEFIASIPEDEDITYEITVGDEDYDVEECEAVKDITTTFTTIIQKLYQLRLTADYVCTAASGPGFETTCNRCEQIRWEVDNELGWFMKASVRYNCGAQNPIKLIQSLPDDYLVVEPSINDVETIINDLASMLELYWCNFESYDQTVITSYIGTWKTQIGYDVAKSIGLL